MRKIVYIIGLSGVLMSSVVEAKLNKDDKKSCEEMGFTVDYAQCALQNRTIPLLCPYSESNGKLKAMCYISSCRGYFLKEEDFSQLASDGKPLSAHIKGDIQFKKANGGGISGCKAGYTQDSNGQLEEVWYYRINQCADGSSFQNGRCDTGCDRTNKYPYDTHPGNLAGTVEGCFDEKGDCFGYTACNDGWNLQKGRCELNQCSITSYPISKNPDIVFGSGRGEFTSCKIGGNAYYKYTSCNEGYTLKGAVCVGKCEIDVGSCSYTTVGSNEPGTTLETVKRWTCKLKNQEACRVGDYATINGKELGLVVHLPDEADDHTVIMATESNSEWKPTQGYALVGAGPCIVSLPIGGSSNQYNYNGKVDTGYMNTYAKTDAAAECTFPATQSCGSYEPSACGGRDFCNEGEWYLPQGYELYNFIYENRYLIASITGRSNYYQSGFWTSCKNTAFLRTEIGVWTGWERNNGWLITPMLEF